VVPHRRGAARPPPLAGAGDRAGAGAHGDLPADGGNPRPAPGRTVPGQGARVMRAPARSAKWAAARSAKWAAARSAKWAAARSAKWAAARSAKWAAARSVKWAAARSARLVARSATRAARSARAAAAHIAKLAAAHVEGLSFEERAATALIVLMALLPVAAPALGGGYLLFISERAMILAIAAVSLELLIGVAGLISFGHAAFLGI